MANYLLKRRSIEPGSEMYGKAFEHFIFNELYAHSSYSGIKYPIRYWRTASGLEIDFVLGDHEVAIEVKATSQANNRHLKGLKSFADEYKVKKLILISNDLLIRKTGDCLVMPWQTFLERLWAGGIYD